MADIFGTNANDPLNGTADDDLIIGAGGADTINANAGSDIVFGDSTAQAAQEPAQIDAAPVSGAANTFFVWDLSDVDVVNASGNSNPFSSNSLGTSTSHVAGSTFSIAEGTSPVTVGLNDNDSNFTDADGSSLLFGGGQVLTQPVTLDGHVASVLEIEYSYIVQDSSGSQITIYAVEEDNSDVVGLISNQPLTLGETYTFVARESTDPSIPYTNIADSYFAVADVTDPGAGDGGVAGDDVINGGLGADALIGGAGDDTINGGADDDVIVGDNAGVTDAGLTGEVSVPSEGGVATLLVWDASNLSCVGGNPFPDGTGGLSDHTVNGITMTINAGSAPVAVGINDGSTSHFNDGDTSQDLVNNEVIDGVQGFAGDRFTPEYSYSVQNVETGETINVYAVELGSNHVVGFVSDAQMEVGATYRFLDNTSTHPSVAYSDLATTYLNPEVGDVGLSVVSAGGATGDDVLDGGAGDDTIFGDNVSNGATTEDFISNGSFEDTTGMTATGYGFVDFGAISGWSASSPGAQIDLHSDGRDGIIATEGSNWLDLEGNSENIRIGQNVQNLVDGEGYRVSFDVNDGPSRISADGPAENLINVYWNGELLQTIDPGNAGGDTTWDSLSFDVVAGSGDGSNRLEFEGTGQLDNFGASVDCVAMVALSDAGLANLSGAGDDLINGGAGDDVIYGDSGNSLSAGGEGVPGDTLGDGPGSTGGGYDRLVGQPRYDNLDFTSDAFYLGNDIPYLDNVNDEPFEGTTFSQDGSGADRAFSMDEIAFENGSRSYVGVISIEKSDVYGSDSTMESSLTGPQEIVEIADLTVHFTMNDGSVFNNIRMYTVQDEDGNTFMVPSDGPTPGGFNAFRHMLATNDSGIASFQIHTAEGDNNGAIIVGGDWADGQILETEEGDGGDDTITGGEGADQMFGEGGDDTFVVSSAADGAGDVISGGYGPDENTDNDVLDLTGAGPVTIDATADANDAGAQSGTVTFADGSTLTFEGIETIIQDPAEVAPDANDDAVTIDEDAAPVTIDVLANDIDPNGDPLTVVDATVPEDQGTVAVVGNQVVFTPAPDFNGDATITYTVEDPDGNQDTAEVAVTVTPVEDAPVTEDDTAATDEDTPVTIDPLANDSDPDGQPLAIAGIPTSPNGTVTVNPDNTIEFTPDPDFNGPTTIDYIAVDPDGNETPGQITVDVAPVVDPDGVVDGLDDGELMNPGYTDPQGDEIDGDDGLDDVVDGNGGDDTIATGAGDDVIDGGTGDDSIDGGDDDDALDGGAGADTLLGGGGNDTITPESPEEANGDVVDGGNGPDDALDNDILDLRGLGPVDIAAEDDPNDEGAERGTVTFENGETLSFEGIEQILSDGPLETAPVAGDDTAAAVEDTALENIDVLGNDVDPNGDPLEVVSATAPNGDVTINPDGTLDYTPDPDFNGEDTITYTVQDPDGNQDTGEVAVTVAPVEDAPVAGDEAPVETAEDTPLENIDVLSNDVDPDGDALEVVEATAPNGTVEINPDGTLSYTPDPDFNGDDTITYTVQDPAGNQDTGEVPVTVTPAEDDPVAGDDGPVTAVEDTPLENIDVLSNDVDPDGDALEVVEATAPNGTVEINPDGTLSYTPDPDFNGDDTITYTVQDPAGNQDTAEVPVSVTPVADLPVAADDTASTDQGEPVTIDVLSNDDDGGLAPLEVTEATAPNGTVTINPDGTLEYTPDAGFEGTDTITYTVENPDGTDEGAVVVTVTDPTQPDGTVDGEETGEVMGEGYDDGAGPTDGGGDVIGAPGADDVVDGNGGDDTIATGAGDDVIDGGTGDDSIDGGDDDDALDGGAGADTLLGGGGNDTITPESPEEANGDVVDGGNGPDDALDNDILDLRGLGPVDIAAEDDPNDEGAERGTVTFENGETLSFEGIEQILSDGPLETAPVAGDDTAAAVEDTALENIDVLGNDVDPNGDPLEVVSATAPNGDVTINPDGTLDYTPDPDFNGEDTITYTVQDPDGNQDTGEVAVTVAPVEDAPVAGDEAPVETAEDTALENIDVLSNDVDPDGDALEVVEATAPNGTVEINPDGTLSYTPDPDFNGDDTITYTVQDPAGNQDTAEVPVSVTPVADLPVAADDTASTDQGEPVTIDVLANDDDGGLAPLEVTEATAPNGTVTINPDGTLEYTPDAGFEGTDTITYTVENPDGTDEGAVVVTVTDPTQPDGTVDGEETGEVMGEGYDDGAGPTDGGGDVIGAPGADDVVDGNGGDDTIATGAGDDVIDGGTGDDSIDGGDDDDALDGGAGADTLLGGGGNDTITPESPEEANGDVVDGGNGPDDALDNDILDLRGLGPVDIAAEDDPNDEGAERGTVTFENGETLSFEGIETILFDSLANTDPTAVDDTAATTPGQFTLIDVLSNDSDPEGDSLEVTSATSAAGATIGIQADGNLLYIPAAGFEGVDTITYEISDGNGGTDTAEVAVSVTEDNVAPVAVDDTAATDENQFTIINVLGNDSDADGDDLSVESVSAANGLVATLSDGSVLYVPNAGFQGEDTISYTVTDGELTDDAVVTVTVGSDNTAPVANDDVASTPVGTFTIIDVLANDSDPEGDALSVEGATAQNGLVATLANGSLIYIPNAGFEGEDEITYTLSDGDLTDTATVAVTVGDPGGNEAPIAVDDTADAVEGTPTIIDVLSNDSDPEGDDLEVTSAMAGNGIAAVQADGSLLYVPNAGFVGTDTITYTLSDGDLTDTAEVVVTVASDNVAPVVEDDTADVVEGTPTLIDVLSNDSDPDGDDLSVETASAANGIVAVQGDGQLLYIPNAGFVGEDTITYTATDGDLSDGGEVVVTVTPDNEAPVVVDDAADVVEGTPTLIDVLSNDSDPDGDDLSVETASAANGIVAVQADGQLLYIPNAGFVGEDTITYTATDGDLSDGGEVVVTVTPDNEAPVAVDDTAGGVEGGVISIDVLSNDSDPDGDDLSVDGASAANGTVAVQANGELLYIPDAGFVGEDTITYTVTDGELSDEGQVTVSVTSGNTAPVAVDDSATTDAETPVVIDVLSNDSDAENDDLSVTATSAANGLAAVQADGAILYLPNAGFEGTDTITYTVSDGDLTDTAEVLVTVNDPTQPDGVVNGEETGEVMLVGYDDGDGPTDGGGDTISETGDVVEGNGGDDVISAGGGEDTIDGGTGNDTIDGNDGDDVLDGGAGEDAIFGGDGNDVITPASAEEADGDSVFGGNGPDSRTDFDVLDLTGLGPVTIDSEADPDDLGATRGTVTFENGETLDFSGIEQILSDGPLDVSPVAVDDTGTANEDGSVLIDVLANDSDPQDDPLTVSNPAAANGTVQIVGGQLFYTPDAHFNGEDTITYTVSDPDGNADTGQAVVTVAPVNDAPVAEDDTASTDEDQTVTIDVLANDSDIDSPALEVTAASAANGTVSINPDGTLEYTPDAGFTGEDTLSYTLSDGTLTDTAEVTVTVNEVAPGEEVDGLGTGEDMDLGYTDQDGDQITNGDDTILGNGGDDTIDGNGGNDFIDGGDGDDILNGGDGDDTLVDGAGNDGLNGGAGTDTYLDTTDEGHIIVYTDDGGNGSITQDPSGEVEDFTSVENFVAAEVDGENDKISFENQIATSEISQSISGISNDVTGLFFPADGGLITFGPDNEFTLDDILAGATGSATGEYFINGGDEDGEINGTSFENFEQIFFGVEDDGDYTSIMRSAEQEAEINQQPDDEEDQQEDLMI